MGHKVRIFLDNENQRMRIIGTDEYMVKELETGGPTKQIDIVSPYPFKVEVDVVDKPSPFIFSSAPNKKRDRS